MLDLHRLRILREVALRGSMTAAAASLAYTQSAISHHIARLEADVGTPLLLRHSRGVRLTEAGRVLVDHTSAVLARLADAEEQVAALAGLRAGRVRLAAFPTAAAAILPPAMAALRARAPAIRVTLVEAEPPEALEALRAGDIDLAVVFSYAEAAPEPVFREIPLMSDRIWVAVPSGHPSSSAGRISLADLKDEDWAAGCERCRAHLIDACQAAGFTPRIAYATDDYMAVQRLVGRGLAITTLPDLAFRLHRQTDLTLLAAPELERRRIFAVVHAGTRPPAVAAMLDELVAVTGAA